MQPCRCARGGGAGLRRAPGAGCTCSTSRRFARGARPRSGSLCGARELARASGARATRRDIVAECRARMRLRVAACARARRAHVTRKARDGKSALTPAPPCARNGGPSRAVGEGLKVGTGEDRAGGGCPRERVCSDLRLQMQANPELLHAPQMKFLKDYIESFGGKVPPIGMHVRRPVPVSAPVPAPVSAPVSMPASRRAKHAHSAPRCGRCRSWRHTRTHARTHAHTHTHRHTRMHARMHARARAHTSICIMYISYVL